MAGCGSDQAVDDLGSRPTLGSTEAPADMVQATTDTFAPEGPIGPPLAAQAPAADILSAVEDAHGPTVDASAQMNRFARFPALGTPEGAVIVELRADVRATLDRSSFTVVSEVALTAAEGPDELAAFYTAELERLGWTVTGSAGEGADGHHLTSEPPASTYALDDLVVAVTPAGPDPAASLVRLHYTELVPASDTTTRQRFEGWAAGLPLPAGGQVTGAGIQTSHEGRSSLYYSLTVDYGGLQPATVADGLRAGLPTEAFGIDTRPPTGDALDDWVYLTSPFFDDARVSPHVQPGGTTLVNVTGRVDFTPS